MRVKSKKHKEEPKLWIYGGIKYKLQLKEFHLT